MLENVSKRLISNVEAPTFMPNIRPIYLSALPFLYDINSLCMDFTRFDRHIIMSQLKRRKLHEGYQIYSRI